MHGPSSLCETSESILLGVKHPCWYSSEIHTSFLCFFIWPSYHIIIIIIKWNFRNEPSPLFASQGCETWHHRGVCAFNLILHAILRRQQPMTRNKLMMTTSFSFLSSTFLQPFHFYCYRYYYYYNHPDGNGDPVWDFFPLKIWTQLMTWTWRSMKKSK